MQSSGEWFWRNYNICLQWQERHKCAYWKSKALALEYERNALLNYIQTKYENQKYVAHDLNGEVNTSPRRSNTHSIIRLGSSDTVSHPKKHGRNRYSTRRRSRTFKRSPPHPCKYPSHEENGFMKRGTKVNHVVHNKTELDKDVIEFFKQSMKHKMELNERKKASEESDSTDSSYIKGRTHTAHKSEEMNLLYGSKSAMIQGMETAMQLTFERNCDKLNPVLWPVLPLKM